MRRVILESPYAGEVEANVAYARLCMRDSISRGEAPSVSYPFFGACFSAVIECDGHEFHERTKRQAARDRSRDRAIQAFGYRIFRFTGDPRSMQAPGGARPRCSTR